jgi:urease accessory protein UreF
MLTMHPTLLIGPSDWQPERMPRDEFTRRIDALWQHDLEADRALVYGTSHRHAELGYFTNLVPKLEAVVALLSRAGEHRLFVGGGVNMLGAARPLTWITELSPLKDLGDALAAGGSMRRSLIVGADYMPVAFRRNVMEAIGTSEAVQDATQRVWAQMRRKSAYEIAAIGHAVEATSATRAVMLEALKSGAGLTEAISAGELAANAAGAQDVRTLFSIDGGRTLRPFLTLVERAHDPLMIYLAIRRFNYWAECFPLFTMRREPTPVYEKAWAAMGSIVQAIEPGTPTRHIEQMIAAKTHPYRSHPLTAGAFARRMGLALEEPPATDIGATFEDGEVYSVRIGVTDGVNGNVICSQMISVRDGGNDGFGTAGQ